MKFWGNRGRIPLRALLRVLHLGRFSASAANSEEFRVLKAAASMGSCVRSAHRQNSLRLSKMFHWALLVGNSGLFSLLGGSFGNSPRPFERRAAPGAAEDIKCVLKALCHPLTFPKLGAVHVQPQNQPHQTEIPLFVSCPSFFGRHFVHLAAEFNWVWGLSLFGSPAARSLCAPSRSRGAVGKFGTQIWNKAAPQGFRHLLRVQTCQTNPCGEEEPPKGGPSSPFPSPLLYFCSRAYTRKATVEMSAMPTAGTR